jgi:hypothetical protein
MAERARPVRTFGGARPRGFAALLAASTVALSLVADVRLAAAHPLDPILFELHEHADGEVDVLWKASRAQVPGVELLPILPPECRRIGDIASSDDHEAVVQRWTLDCSPHGLAGLTVGVSGLESTDALLRVELAGGAIDRRVLGVDHPSAVIAAAPTRFDVARDYARLGSEHIGTGLDHLLFVFGLLLLAGGARALFATITAFTLGHSVTLALAALQIVSVPQLPAEIVIAGTIYILAVELARPAGPGETLLRRRPWAMAFAFGLLHGLSFAGALRAAGLPATDVPLALFSFNVGIEAGQLVFVTAVLTCMAATRTMRESWPAWTRLVPVYVMGTTACYWMILRASML